jgi:hypothetical protein
MYEKKVCVVKSNRESVIFSFDIFYIKNYYLNERRNTKNGYIKRMRCFTYTISFFPNLCMILKARN